MRFNTKIYEEENNINSDYKIVYTCFRKKGDDKHIEIYVCDKYNYKIFIFSKDCPLEESDENEFFKYFLYSEYNTIIKESFVESVVEDVQREYPEIVLKMYPDIKHTLLHLYFCMYDTGVYRLLFEKGLNYIAANLHNIPNYNSGANTPEDIFDIQPGMLQCLNSEFGAGLLENGSNWGLADIIYKVFDKSLDNIVLNEFQWRYLTEIFLAGCSELNRDIIDHIRESVRCDIDYKDYMEYLDSKNTVENYYETLTFKPSRNDISVCKDIYDMIIRKNYYNKLIHEGLTEFKDKYEYEDDNYMVETPQTLEDIIKVSAYFKVPLYYLLNATDNPFIFLLIRSKQTNELEFVIDLYDSDVLSAYTTGYADINEKQEEWLCNYMTEKGIDDIRDQIDNILL